METPKFDMEAALRGLREGKELSAGEGTVSQGESVRRNRCATDPVKKSPGHLGHRRGRMISESMKQMAIALIDEAVTGGARYTKACEVLGIICRTLRRWRRRESLSDGRKGANRTCPHALSPVEKQRILEVCNRPEYKSLPPSQIVPRLADTGEYCGSESSYYRVLREHEQGNRRGRAKTPRKVAKPKAWVATEPNQVWSWDITYLPAAIHGHFYRLYMTMDIFSRSIVGWEVHHEELACHAAALIDKACQRHPIAPDQLVLHADNGGPMKGATMLAKRQELGMVPSFSRPSVSNDNPFSEAAFRTLKYVPSYPSKPFQSIAEAREWVQRFVVWYNTEHRHSGIRSVTPQQRHDGQDHAILNARKTVYIAAKRDHPDRWRGRAVRDWSPIASVSLNADKPTAIIPEAVPFAA